jgi:hypothetical protein
LKRATENTAGHTWRLARIRKAIQKEWFNFNFGKMNIHFMKEHLYSISQQGRRIIVCYRKLPYDNKEEDHWFTNSLKRIGVPVVEIGDEAIERSHDNILIVWGNANWYPKLLKQLETIGKLNRPLVIIWHTEPLPPPKGSGLKLPGLNIREIAKIALRDKRATDVYTNYFRLRSLNKKGIPDLLLVSTKGRQEFLALHDIESSWVSMGYDPINHGFPLDLVRDIDVLFLGACEVSRRKRLFKRLGAAGVDLQAIGSWYDPDYWGRKRIELVNRTKIFLNLQRYEGDLSGDRMILGMANKALIISEPIYEPAPYVPGKHYISSTIEEMPTKIEYFLSHDDEREHIVDEAYKFVSQNLTIENTIGQIIGLIQNHHSST